MHKHLLAILVFINLTGFAQLSQDNIEDITNTREDLFETLHLKLKTDDDNNSVYLIDEWSQFNITLQTGKVLDAIIAKYDIKNNQFEIRNKNRVGILNGDRVKAFGKTTLYDQSDEKAVFLNVKNFNLANEDGYKKGFAQRMYKGEKKELYKYHTVKIIETSGNTALGIKGGISFSKNEETVVYDSNSFSKLASNKKKNLRFFGKEASQVMDYIKENKLSFKKEEDIKEIFIFYDQLENQI